MKTEILIAISTLGGAIIGAAAAIFVNVYYENKRRAKERAFKTLETRLEKLYSPLAATFGMDIIPAPKTVMNLMENNLYLASVEITAIYKKLSSCYSFNIGGAGIKGSNRDLYMKIIRKLRKEVNKEMEKLLEQYYEDYNKYY